MRFLRSKRPILPCSFSTICFLFLVSKAQPGEVQFEHISLEQGLSQTSVFAIVQDHRGFIWFGTQDGLNKYDGYSFTVYRRNAFDTTSLSDNYISALFVDRSGTLWVGTRGGGLNRFSSATGKFTHYRNLPNDPHSISDDQIVALSEDSLGVLWIATSNGLNALEPATGRISRYLNNPSDEQSIPNNYVQSLFVDQQGTLWVGMIRGAAVLDREHQKFNRLQTSVPVELFDGFAQDAAGSVWATTPQGIFRFMNGSWRIVFDSSATKAGHGILRDRNGFLWAGSHHGLLKIDPVQKTFIHYVREPSNDHSLNGNAVISLCEDRTGILWFGTYEGINKYAPLKNRFKSVRWNDVELQSMGWNKIRGISEGKDGVYWVATQAGLARYNEREDRLERFYSPHQDSRRLGVNFLWSIQEDRNASGSTQWIGTNGDGLIRMEYSGHNGSMKPVYKKYLHHSQDTTSISGNVVLTMLESRSGTLWMGTLLEGLNSFEPTQQLFHRFRSEQNDPRSLSHNEVWSLCEDMSGALWIGTAGGGLNRFIPGTHDFQRFQFDPNNPNSLSDNKVTAILEGKDGALWIGTYAGLNRLDRKTETFTHYTTNDGLPNDVIYGILEDVEGNIWLSTNKGLSRFNIQSQRFRNYDAGDGLQSNEFNQGAAYKSRGGKMLFGGVNGFNVFYPDSLMDNRAVPEIVFTDFKLFNRSLSPTSGEQRLTKVISEADRVLLSYRDTEFSIEFAALEYTNPAKNQYAYMMEGFDKGWNFAGSKREATYTNLDPGEYVFRVKASNNDGVWNEQGASVRIIITPPYWQTWWFRSLMILIAVSSGPYIYYRRVKTLKREHALQQEFSRKLIASQETERKRIASELHDSVGQDLLIIRNKLLIGMGKEGESQNQRTEFNDAVEQVSKSLKNVREISRNLRPVQLDQLGLTTALQSVIEMVEESSSMKFSVQLDNIDGILSKENEINLFRIVQEGLNNILKHSRATSVTVRLKKNPQILSVTIEDNGIGMLTEQQQGFGMTSMKERTRILGGDLRIESNPGEGAKVILMVPIAGETHA